MRYNLLWIFVDQLRTQSLACHGDPNVATPNLDRLAAEGVDFVNAVSPCPVCTPARGSVMTGSYGSATGIRYLGDLLPPSQRTAAHVFRDAGYRTGYVGKWHLASSQNPYGHNEGAEYWVHPLLRGGFEDWAGFELSNHFWNTRYSTDDSMWPPKKLEGYQTDGLTRLSMDYLSERARTPDVPWFHVLSLETPHHGSDADGVSFVKVGELGHTRHPAPPEYENRFPPSGIELRDNVPPDFAEVARSQQAQYAAMIANLDDNVGRLLDRLEETGLADTTVVVFFSDHGELGGSHGYFQKCAPYAESLLVPLLVRLPAGVREIYGAGKGRVVHSPASLVDLLPTCASLCGVPLTTQVQGLDLGGLALGTTGAVARDFALSQWFGNPRYDPSVFGGLKWRAIHGERYTFWVDSAGKSWLFDNQDDPMQMHNLAESGDHRDRLPAFRDRLVREILRSGEAVPEWIGQW